MLRQQPTAEELMRGPQASSPAVARATAESPLFGGLGSPLSSNMNTVCEVCGNIGFKHLLICCRDCRCSAVHRYCLDTVVFDTSLADWLCDECLQKHGKACCYKSLEVSSYAHFRPTIHQPVTKRVESESNACQYQNILGRAEKLSSKNTNHENRKNQHASAMCKNVNVNGAKDNKTMVSAHSNQNWAANWPRNNIEMSEVYGDDNSNVIDVLMVKRENEEAEFHANKELQQRSMAANVPVPSTLQSNSVEKVMPFSASHACDGRKNITSIQERNMGFLHISGSSQYDKAESSESGEIFVECQKDSSYHHGESVKVAPTFLSCQDSGEDIPSEKESLESDDLESPPGDDYVLSRTSFLSEEQKKRVVNLIKKSKPGTTVFVAVMRNSNVQPPGPCLGISKEYALSHFPHTTTNVTLQRPGNNKKWYPIFYKNDESRKNMLMGQWLDFVRENHVQEGDICLLAPERGEGRSMFTVYLVRATSAHSRCRAGSQSVKPCPVGSIGKTSSEVHMEEPTDGKHISSESYMCESSHVSLECKVSNGLPQPPYIVPCRNRLSKSQKRIVEKTVRAIKSEVPICVAIMKNNNVGVAQRWMLELGSRFASVHLPAKGQTMVLQCGRKVWETKMMYHTGRRWTLNGGWPQFARDNGLRVGDICLLELKKNERKLTMRVHIISTEQL